MIYSRIKRGKPPVKEALEGKIFNWVDYS